MRRALPYLLAAMVLVAGFASLRQYNVTWDEALGDLFFGQRYFAFFTTLDKRDLDFTANPPGLVPDLTTSPFRIRPWEHYPVASTLATATSHLLSFALDPFDGYHAFNLLIAAIFVVVFYRFVEDGWGPLAATMSIAFLFLSPRVTASLMANVKDFSEMVFFSLAAMLFFNAVERASRRGILVSGLLLGLALGTKANAIFLPVITGLYLLTRRKRTDVPAFAGWLALGAIVFFISWPYLWRDPVRAVWSNAQYLLQRKSATASQNTAGPFTMLAYTTPVLLLAAFAAGAIAFVRRRDARSIFLGIWIAVISARLLVPAAVNFDGVRHFLELFPPVAAVAGAGLVWALARVRPLLRASASAAVAVALAFSLARVHPFETAYWNVIAGGLPGAMAKKIPQAGDYWAASYRIGLRWLNANAPRGSVLAVPIAEHTVRLVQPYRLRSDIQLAHVVNPWRPRLVQGSLEALQRETRPVFVMTILRRDWSNALVMDAFQSGHPVAVWTLDGAPVLLIFRYR